MIINSLISHNKHRFLSFWEVLYFFLILALLFLGLLNPVKGNGVDTFVAYFLFGFVAIYVFLPKVTAGFGRYAIWVVILCFLISAFSTGFGLRAMFVRDLPLYTYNNDEGAFLKTLKMMKGNTNYYDAYRVAFIGKFENHNVPKDVWGWRLPTIFEIWRLTPGNGIGIYFLYLFLASGIIYTAYMVGKRYIGDRLAILPAYLVFPYLHFAGRDQIVLLTEWWAVGCFLIGLYLFVARRYFFSILFISLAVMIREIYVMPIALMFLYFFIRRKRQAVVFLIAIVGFLLLLLFHIAVLSSYINSWQTIFNARIVSSGVFFVEQTFAFGSWEYSLYFMRPFLLFFVLAVCGCFYIWRSGRKDDSWLWLLAFVPFPIAFLRFGTVPYNDYWSIMYLPTILVLAPLTLGFFQKRNQ